MASLLNVLLAIGVGMLPPPVDELVSRHEASLNKMHCFRATLQVVETPLSPNAMTSELEIKWLRRGEAESLAVRKLNSPKFPDGISRKEFAACTRNGGESRVLYNWNPAAPRGFTPSDQGVVQGAIIHGALPDARNEGGLLIPPAPRLMLRMTEGRSLRAFLEASTEVSGALNTIRGRAPHGARFEMTLSPDRGWLVARCEYRLERFPPSIFTVEEFREVAPAIWFPWRTRRKMGDKDQEAVGVTDFELNPKTDERSFQMPFPRGLLVSHYPADKGFNKVDLWGGDGPERTFEDQSEYLAFIQADVDRARAAEWWRSLSRWLGGGVFAALVLLGGWRLWAWRKAQGVA